MPGLLVGGVSDSVPFALSILVQSVYFLLLTLAALRHGRQADPVDREQLRLLSAALLLYPAAAVGHFLVEGRYPAPLLGVVLVALLAGLWIWNGRGGPPRERRSCRNLALLGPAVALATALFVSLASRTFSDPPGGPHWGLSRMVGVLLLAYAILRHQLLGLDAKVRWGISRSTVAAAFVAVFFVVSEGAQVLFAGFAQSELLGIGAAGLLVFALAPLQRIADRLATRAIPGPSSDATPGRATYRAALRVALADGGVSPREEMELAHLQRELDLDPVEVLRLRQEEEGRGDPGDAGPE